MILSQLGKNCRPGKRICLDVLAGRQNLPNFDKTWRPGERICPNLTNVVRHVNKFVQMWPMLLAGRAILSKFVECCRPEEWNWLKLFYWLAASANLSYFVCRQYSFVLLTSRKCKFVICCKPKMQIWLILQAGVRLGSPKYPKAPKDLAVSGSPFWGKSGSETVV